MRWRVTITAETGRARTRWRRGPGRLSGGHLLDEPHRQAAVERRIHQLQQQTRGRPLARVHDHHDGADFLGGGTGVGSCRLVYLEDVAERHAVTFALVDEEELLRAGNRMRVAAFEQLAGEALVDRRRANLAGIAERLERHREMPFVNPGILRDDFREDLLLFDLRHARNPDGNHHVAPLTELQAAIDAGERQRVDRGLEYGQWGDVVIPIGIARVTKVEKQQVLAEVVAQYARIHEGHLAMPLE